MDVIIKLLTKCGAYYYILEYEELTQTLNMYLHILQEL